MDGLLDDDGVVPDMKTEESPKLTSENKSSAREPPETLSRLSDAKSEDPVQEEPERAGNNVDEGPIVGEVRSDAPSGGISSESNLEKDPSPTPIPRQRVKTSAVEAKTEPVARAEARKSSIFELFSDKEESPPTQKPRPSRFISVDGYLSAVNSSREDEKDCFQEGSGDTDPCDGNAKLKERLVGAGNDKSTLLKAKSCGAGLDSDESISSNEYKPKMKEQGSLLSLPTGAEPKRKKNFMDKCVNKVRSFMRK